MTIHVSSAALREPWSRIFGGNESTPIPIDPEDLDATRPADIDDCTVCGGTGQVDVPSADGHPRVLRVDIRCRSCDGSGEIGGAR